MYSDITESTIIILKKYYNETDWSIGKIYILDVKKKKRRALS